MKLTMVYHTLETTIRTTPRARSRTIASCSRSLDRACTRTRASSGSLIFWSRSSGARVLIMNHRNGLVCISVRAKMKRSWNAPIAIGPDHDQPTSSHASSGRHRRRISGRRALKDDANPNRSPRAFSRPLEVGRHLDHDAVALVVVQSFAVQLGEGDASEPLLA